MLVLLTTDRGVPPVEDTAQIGPPVEDTGAVDDAGRNPPAEDIAVGVLVDIGGVAWIGCLALWSPEFVSLFGNTFPQKSDLRFLTSVLGIVSR